MMESEEQVPGEDDWSDRLEDDDYDLIEENLGVKVQRRKFKRLKRMDDDSDQEESQAQNDREAIANQLFEGSDNEEERHEPVREETYASEESEEEYSETDDFIVDDEGRPLRDVRRKRRPIYTDATLQAAQDIFSVDFDYEEFEKYGNEYYEEEDDEDEDDDDGDRRRRGKQLPRSKRTAKSIYELYEPHELERAGFTEEDNRIKNLDVPERMQLRSVPVTRADEDELDEEAEWIFKTAFSNRVVKLRPVFSVAHTVIQSEANWDDDWDKRTRLPAPAATTIQDAQDEDWGAEAVAATAPKATPSTTIPRRAGNEENWDDEDWEKTPAPVMAPPPAPIPRRAATVVNEENWDEEDWEKTPAPAAPVMAPPPAPIQRPAGTAVVNVENSDEEDWETPSAARAPAKVGPSTATAPIPPPAGTVVNEENWDEENWGAASTTAAPKKATHAALLPAAPTAPAPIPRPVGTVVNEENWDEENWEESSAVAAAQTKKTTVLAPPPAPAAPAPFPRPAGTVVNEENWDQENWEVSSSVAAPAKVAPAPVAAPIPIPRPAVTVVNEENWDQEQWEKASSVAGPTKVAPPAQIQRPSGTVINDKNCESSAMAASVEEPAPPAAQIRRPARTVVNEENWDKENWEAGAKDSGAADGDAVSESTPPEQAPEESRPPIIPKIRKALEFMRNDLLEVPFINFYRKEYVQPGLTMDDLWKIYKLDARFCQLKMRKNKLTELFKNMQEYQTDQIMVNPDYPNSDSIRLITDKDIERIQTMKSADELKDMYLFFSLHYADDVEPMKRRLIQKRREERRRARVAAAAEKGESEEALLIPEGDDEPDQEDVMRKGVIRRKIGAGPYTMCKKMGVDALVKKFGLSPEKFAENLSDNYQRHEIDQCPLGPEEAAMEIMTERTVGSEEEALRAAKFMLATQISREPLVRQCVREVFFERATISCYPTKKGQKEIDEAHPCAPMKYIKDKPVRDLTADQFLKLTLAETDRLMTITIGEKIKGITADTYVDEVKQLFQKDEFSKRVQDWNTLRGECIEFALEKLLFPILQKELRAKLLEDAKEYVLTTCCQKLHNWLEVGPYKITFPDEDEEEWDTSRGIRVLAIAYVPDYEQASFACIVSPDGEPADYLRLKNILKSKNSPKEENRKEKEADLLAIKNFIRDKKPHVIVIGGESRDALNIQTDLRDIANELVNEDAFPIINVEIIDNQLAKVYANSIKFSNDLGEYPPVLRQAVSLGRRLQDPLIEFSQLCTADDEILCMRFHNLQDHIPKDELLEHLQLEFVKRTNDVGVDVNRALAYPYTSNLVQFTCGLGPRKATALLKTLKQANQRLENRTQLITVCHMGPKIFINCAGFIKIDTHALGDSCESYVEVLDGTRVHPENYEWTIKMATDALEYGEDETNRAGAVDEILESPEKLKDLDLDAFAAELERQGFGDKSVTLYDIREELTSQYKDRRRSYVSPAGNELFNMLTKETPETLYVGKLVMATVIGIGHKKPKEDELENAVPNKMPGGTWQCAFCGKNDFPELPEVWNHFDAGDCPGSPAGVRLRLDNGISGFIPNAKLSEKHQVTEPEQFVRMGQILHCRILKVEPEKFSVLCTSRTSDLQNKKGEWGREKDEHYDQEQENLDLKQEEDLCKKKLRQTYTRRVIIHPAFKNISFREAEKLLETMDQGAAIVRPSSKGADHLTVTWKVADGIYQHIDVREEKKENAFSLGQSLWIDSDEFEDLDEIIARHVNPMATHARDLINYKYYMGNLGGNRARADEYLKVERKKNAKKSHYVFHASKEYPGKFLLSYYPGSKTYHEFVTVTVDGFRYRQQNFDTVDELVNWFKKHYTDPLPSKVTMTQDYAPQAPLYADATPRYDDTDCRIGAPPMSHFSAAPTAFARPHYIMTAPTQAFIPYSSLRGQTPYTPSASTVYMTPFRMGDQSPYTPGQTPYQQGDMSPDRAGHTPYQAGHTPHQAGQTPRRMYENYRQW